MTPAGARAGAVGLLLLAGLPALANLPVAPPPGAVVSHASGPAPGRYPLPTGPVSLTERPLAPLDGQIETAVWRMDGEGPGALALLRSVAEPLLAAGWQPGFDCSTRACGGFDFRFALPVVPPPEMEVDLAEFHFRALSQGDRTLTLLASRAGNATFLQLTLIRSDAGPQPITASTLPPPAPGAEPVTAVAAPDDMATSSPEPEAAESVARGTAPGSAPPAPASVADTLARTGRAVLGGVAFDPGRATLATGSAPVLEALAALMQADPGVRVTIVGHTDSTGTLAANLALSRARAEAVAAVLTRKLKVEAARVTAAGVGPLAPLASNATEAGRTANRRVEVVLR